MDGSEEGKEMNILHILECVALETYWNGVWKEICINKKIVEEEKRNVSRIRRTQGGRGSRQGVGKVSQGWWERWIRPEDDEDWNRAKVEAWWVVWKEDWEETFDGRKKEWCMEQRVARMIGRWKGGWLEEKKYDKYAKTKYGKSAGKDLCKGVDNGLHWYMKKDYDVKGRVIWTKFYRSGEG